MKPGQDNSKEDWKRLLAEEEAIIDFTEETLRRMEEINMTRTALAEKLDVDPAAVTKLLSGRNNFTLRTMVKIARALRARITYSYQPIKVHSAWIPKPSYVFNLNFAAYSENKIPMQVYGLSAASGTFQVTGVGKTEEQALAS